MSIVTRQVGVAVRALALFTVLLGLAYPAVVTLIGQVALPAQANGSLIRASDGTVVGSSLIGQSFLDAAGNPDPRYFQPRPSAGGYDGAASGGSNLGPENPDLIGEIAARRAAVAAFNGVPASQVPADAVTASASGLDPDISPAYAQLQVARVARARGLGTDVVERLVAAHTGGGGYLSQTIVNVVELNLALDRQEG